MTTTTHPRIALAQAGQYIANRLSFTCNRTLRATYFNSFTGRLPEDRVTGFNRATDADDFYAVYSYQTPIAWYAHGTWVVPDVKYSPTTSRHQSIVRNAVCL